jgi:hypothetical protein
MRFQTTVAFAFVLLASQPSLAQSEAWEPYRDPNFGFTALLPTQTFAPVVDTDGPGLTPRSLDESAQINIMEDQPRV